MNLKQTIYGLLIIGFVFSCKHKEGEYHSLKEKIEEESENYHDPGISSEAYIGDFKTVEVTEGEHTFLIPERKSQIQSYSCTECHSGPLSQLQPTPENERAHWDIKLNHANETALNCASCHNGDDMNHLRSLTGMSIDFNNSYELCMQCHSPQYKDWKGGAHGKNIGGWAKPRVAMTCVNCHNPHKPQIPSKWPVRFNTIKEKERN